MSPEIISAIASLVVGAVTVAVGLIPWYRQRRQASLRSLARDDPMSAHSWESGHAYATHLRIQIAGDVGRSRGKNRWRRRGWLVPAATALSVFAIIAIAIVVTRLPRAQQNATIVPPALPQSFYPAAVLHNPGGHRAEAVAFSRDGSTIVTGDQNGNIYLWNAVTREIALRLHDPDSAEIVTVAFSPVDGMVASGDRNGTAYVWNLATHALVRSFHCPGLESVSTVAFSPDGADLAAAGGGKDANACVWSLANGANVGGFGGPGGGNAVAAFSPDGKTVAISVSVGTVWLWPLAQFPAGFRTISSPGEASSITFSNDGRTLAIGNVNGSTYLWNVATLKRSASFADPGKSGGIYGIAFNADDTEIATADLSGSTYLWNLSTGALSNALPDPASKGVTAVAFDPKGTVLATADLSGTTYLWGVTSQIRRQGTLALAANGTAYDLDSLAADWQASMGQSWTVQNISYTLSADVPVLLISDEPYSDVVLAPGGNWTYRTCVDAAYGPDASGDQGVAEGAALDPGRGICVRTGNNAVKHDGGHYALLVVLARTPTTLTLEVTVWQKAG